MLAITLAKGFVLRFEAKGPPEPDGIRFIGLELGSFEAVDDLYETLAGRIPMVEDLRAQYATTKGPYGFIMADPNGCRLKLFKDDGPKEQSYVGSAYDRLGSGVECRRQPGKPQTVFRSYSTTAACSPNTCWLDHRSLH